MNLTKQLKALYPDSKVSLDWDGSKWVVGTLWSGPAPSQSEIDSIFASAQVLDAAEERLEEINKILPKALRYMVDHKIAAGSTAAAELPEYERALYEETVALRATINGGGS